MRWVIALAFLVGCGSFCLYGEVRTLTENVGFSPTVSLASAAVAGFYHTVGLSAFAIVVWLAQRLRGRKLRVRVRIGPSVGLLVLAFAIGSIASELLILRDEAAFARETALNVGVPYARPRAWPNAGASLVYDGKATHATD